MYARRAPQRVIPAHCPDQIADLGLDRRSANTKLPRSQRPSVSDLKMTVASSSEGNSRLSQTKISQSAFRSPSLAGADRFGREQLLAEKRHLSFPRHMRFE
jgi:hypothetical protein